MPDPTPVSPSEQEELKRLQAIYSGDVALANMREFAKWVFGTVAVVMTLGTVLGTVTYSELGESSQFSLVVAGFLTSAALVCATLALTPRRPQIKLKGKRVYPGFWDEDELRQALIVQVRSVRSWARASSVFVALALLAAGIGPVLPVLSEVDRAAANLTYEVGDRGLEATASFSGTEPGESLVLEAVYDPPNGQSPPRTEGVADADGNAKLELHVERLPAPATVVTLQVSRGRCEKPEIFVTSKIPFLAAAADDGNTRD